MKDIKQIAKKLNGSGLKVTPQRIAVLQALSVAGYHPTAEEIYNQVSKGIPGLSPTTVYNVLDALSARNIIRRIKTETGPARYDGNVEPHYHIYDENSEELKDYFDPELEKLLNDYFKKKTIDNFQLKDIKLQIVGSFNK